jgi:hypothetical protein
MPIDPDFSVSNNGYWMSAISRPDIGGQIRISGFSRVDFITGAELAGRE